METEATEAREGILDRSLVIYGLAAFQGFIGFMVMVGGAETPSLGDAFYLTAGAMMIVGSVGMALRESWGWTIAAVFDLVYLLLATGALSGLVG